MSARLRLPHRSPVTIIALVALLLAGLGAYAIVASGDGHRTTAQPATSTSQAFGPVPGAGDPTGRPGGNDAGAPYGVGEFCRQLDQLKGQGPIMQYYYEVGDLGGLRSSVDIVNQRFRRLAERAPGAVRADLLVSVADFAKLTDFVDKATAIGPVRDYSGAEFPGILVRGAPASRWVMANCPETPQPTTTAQATSRS